MSKIKLIYFLFLTIIISYAQEGLKPMTANINYIYKDLKVTQQQNTNLNTAKTATASLQLPFIEDFFYAQFTNYPNQLLWSDSSAYINTGYPIAPPSIGVATFDGLNKFGYPYLPNLTNLNSSLPADTLTSKPINLKTVGAQTLQIGDSVALSFFYQARGNGDNPEITDTLLVDFYNPLTTKWKNVWFQRGNTSPNTNDTIFKRAFIWVDSAYYLNDGFKFRFRNKATIAGNFDHWHVDYVKLDRLRSKLGDTLFNDLTFGYIPSPVLKNYSEMPWQQYTPAEMATQQSVKIRNNDGVAINASYSNSIITSTVAVTGATSYNGGSTNLGRFKTQGWNKHPPHNNPPISYIISPLGDSAEIKIQHVIARAGAITDFSSRNDTVIQSQRFKNYFAYDDGTCEAGYYILGQGGKMAVKFSLNTLDTLRAVRIYFNPVGALTNVQNNYNFIINLWANGASGPGATIYIDTIRRPKYFNLGYNTYADYTLKTKQILGPSTYYIGLQQQVANGIIIGFDRNLDHHQNLFYDSGTGWTQSSIFGSLMLRPVFGANILPPVGINELNTDSYYGKNNLLKVYPNPTNENLIIEYQNLNEALINYNNEIKIYNSLGQMVHHSKISNQKSSINVIDLPNGIYYLVCKSNNQTIQSQKIIVQH